MKRWCPGSADALMLLNQDQDQLADLSIAFCSSLKCISIRNSCASKWLNDCSPKHRELCVFKTGYMAVQLWVHSRYNISQIYIVEAEYRGLSPCLDPPGWRWAQGRCHCQPAAAPGLNNVPLFRRRKNIARVRNCPGITMVNITWIPPNTIQQHPKQKTIGINRWPDDLIPVFKLGSWCLSNA